MTKLNNYQNFETFGIKLLQILATSVPAELMFSKAGDVMTDKRLRLKPETLLKLIFFKLLVSSEI
jgi:hAT family C-terminal dimerisation region